MWHSADPKKWQKRAWILYSWPLFSPLIRVFYDVLKEHPLLTWLEESALATRALAGDIRSRNVLVEANMRFVVQQARKLGKYCPTHVMDLIQEGALGLIAATSKYDPAIGTRFLMPATMQPAGLWMRGLWTLSGCALGWMGAIPRRWKRLRLRWVSSVGQA